MLQVVQRYIANPVLVHGRKFHLRVWVVVTQHAPLQAYMHRCGLALFSSAPYTADEPAMCTASGDDALTFSKLAAPPTVSACHITNYAKNTDGWVWNLGRVQQHFGEAVWGEIWARMLRSAGLTVAAARQSLQEATEWLQPSIQHYGFQLLGFDYLLDSSLQPWLLEVNSAPSITVHHANPDICQLIHDAKYAMLRDMLQLVQHRLYSDTTGPKTGKRRPTRPVKPQKGTAAETNVQGDGAQAGESVGGFVALMPHFGG
ncbi:MAG: hypothetical protein WDW38_003621 [Sanguina aurantia]